MRGLKDQPSSYALLWQMFPNYDPEELTPTPSKCNNTDCSDAPATRSPDSKPARPASSGLPTYLHILRHHRKLHKIKNKIYMNVKSIYDTHDSTGATSHNDVLCAASKFPVYSPLSSNLVFVSCNSLKLCIILKYFS